MSLVLGFMIASAWVNTETRRSRLGLLGPAQGNRVQSGTIDMQDAVASTQAEVAKLRTENTKLQNAMASQTSSTKALNDSLQEAKRLAGLTDLEGPGIRVELRDSKKPASAIFPGDLIIHDVDVLKVVNELWNAGAEAITVNNHRVVGGTSFRCVGSVILVDDVRIATPIVIRAIGDPNTLTGALELPEGVLADLKEIDPAMAVISKVDQQRLPAYTGSTATRIGSLPKDSK
ncbi:MAG TPA: DUF881 domain-containing protein [Fimbriimonadaceae bacterium]|jgi:uncharacterized protein YlxW (UPF0749 family)|nr:DUF881 domain-containing protein [Fimbriimonadaceae bacterium]